MDNYKCLTIGKTEWNNVCDKWSVLKDWPVFVENRNLIQALENRLVLEIAGDRSQTQGLRTQTQGDRSQTQRDRTQTQGDRSRTQGLAREKTGGNSYCCGWW